MVSVGTHDAMHCDIGVHFPLIKVMLLDYTLMCLIQVIKMVNYPEEMLKNVSFFGRIFLRAHIVLCIVLISLHRYFCLKFYFIYTVH